MTAGGRTRREWLRALFRGGAVAGLAAAAYAARRGGRAACANARPDLPAPCGGCPEYGGCRRPWRRDPEGGGRA